MTTATDAKKKYTFKLLRGGHCEGNRLAKTYKEYSRGDIIETNNNLIKIFPDSRHDAKNPKFQRIYESDKSADGLEELTFKQLQNLAVEEEVELNSTDKKQDIILAIRATS